MTAPNLLLLSSSRANNSGYLESSRDWIAEHVGDRELLFVPFAGVTVDWDEYLQRVQEALDPVGVRVTGIHRASNAQQAVREAQAIAVGGGNTFQLLKTIYDWQLLDLIRERVLAGVPYVGWSAGSNIAAPTICTTNDMPIVEPASFAALNLLPFQINPHYSDFVPPNFHGETREQRLQEFLAANPSKQVIALREGSALKRRSNTLTLLGSEPALRFQHKKSLELLHGPDLSHLLG
ncbi:dipeptidase PepE [Permianibacter sp. IMCC34836]|uniref:dipeptidase PepE n=1 Tax=Permianibacter fluminis TaxID=2738515 RepID=UPI001552C5D5|nr:dipeptidase PepE [Permianibacter fluminis]NQD37321.1 dipeptidase PepE [Permianibacter fluminis]